LIVKRVERRYCFPRHRRDLSGALSIKQMDAEKLRFLKEFRNKLPHCG
jgi:hypothetical protein